MAAVTKNLAFAITSSTSFEAPYALAKRFSTLDHLTKGRFGWNIVTSFKESGAKAVRYFSIFASFILILKLKI
jgi:alkanesulfonate monooxygenase SsuD/methylene tetrahydromethanopterin reductase-like flavin-dependent oxidoreductase (luciferase family)